jgi:hypothetical protein
LRGERPTPEDWNRARRALQRARGLDPENPAHAEILARWYERYALRLPPSSGLAPIYLQESAAHLRQALAGRPGSPYAWASLAAVKLRLGELDAELDTAVGNARRLGLWEPGVRLALKEIESARTKR